MSDLGSVLVYGSFGLVLLYAVSVCGLALVQRMRGADRQLVPRLWNHELAVTTWVFATPGLILAAYGLLIGIGLVLVPLGVAVGVIATRVSLRLKSVLYWFPLAFVGTVDALVVAALADEVAVSPRPDGATFGAVLAYLVLATINAVRISSRGLANSRARRRGADESGMAVTDAPTPLIEATSGE
jgi:hypothetical protein